MPIDWGKTSEFEQEEIVDFAALNIHCYKPYMPIFSPRWKKVLTSNEYFSSVAPLKRDRQEYFAVLYYNEQRNQAVIVTRGTDSIRTWLTEDVNILFNKKLNWEKHADEFYKHIKEKYAFENIAHTGHSAGGVTEVIQAIKYNERCVVFDTPYMSKYYEKHHKVNKNIDIFKNITWIVSDKNLINHCHGQHFGNVIRIQVENIHSFTKSLLPIAKNGLTGVIGTQLAETIESLNAHRISNIHKEMVNYFDKLRDPSSNIESLSLPNAELMRKPQDVYLKELSAKGINFVNYTSDKIIFHVSPESLLLKDNQVHAMLGDVGNIKSLQFDNAVSSKLKVPIKYNNNANLRYEKKADVPKKSLITGIKFGYVDDNKIGIITKLSNNTEIALGAGAGGVIVFSVKIEFGASIIAGLGTATAVGAIVAGVLLATRYFYNKHLDLIQIKLKQDIKHTNQDISSISNALNKFSFKIREIDESDLQEVIDDANDLMYNLENKISKESDRARKANKHSKKASKVHIETAKNYQKLQVEIKEVKKSLAHDKVMFDFINQYKDISVNDLVELARQITNKNKYTIKDVAQIEGVRHLIVENVCNLFSSGNSKKARALLAETEHLTYFKPGNVDEFLLQSSNHTPDKHMLGHINKINRKIAEINNFISSGKNPTSAINDLLAYIGIDSESRHTVYNRWVHGPDNLKRTNQLKNFSDTLKAIKSKYESCNMSTDIKLSNLSSYSETLSANFNKPISFWVEELKKSSEGNESLDSEQAKLLRSAASYNFTNNLIDFVNERRFDDAVNLINEFKPYASDLSLSYDECLAKIQWYNDHRDEDFNFWFKEQTQIVNKPIKDHDRLDSISQLINQGILINFVYKATSIGNFNEVGDQIIKLEQLESTSNKVLWTKIRNEIVVAKSYKDKDQHTMLEIFNKIMDKQCEIQVQNNKIENDGVDSDSDNATVKQISLLSTLPRLTEIADKHAELGHYGKAAELIDVLMKKNPNLPYNDLSKDYWFQHHNQIINIFIPPFQDMVSRYARDMKNSKWKTTASIGLELLNTGQILIPNGLALAAQGIYERYATGSIDVFNRNFGNVLAKLKNTLKNPHHHYGNGAMIWSQLLLKFMQHMPLSPLKYFLADNSIYKMETIRDTIILPYGSLATRCIQTGISALQLAKAFTLNGGLFSPAYTPCIITVSRELVNAGYWMKHYYHNSRGEAVEEFDHYQEKKAIDSTITIMGTVLTVGAVTGGLGWVALAAGGLMSHLFIKDITRDATWKELAREALLASMHNVNYYNNLQNTNEFDHSNAPVITEYTKKCKYTARYGDPDTAAQHRIATGDEICFIKKKTGNIIEYYLVYRNKKETMFSKILQPPSWLNDLKERQYFVFPPSHLYYKEMFKYATSRVIDCYIISSVLNILKLLSRHFGLQYDNNQLQEINIARVMLLHNTVKTYYDKNDYANVIDLTKAFIYKNNTIINDVYGLPPHLVSHTLLTYRLAIYAQSKEYLKDFRDQYQTYSKYLYDSSLDDKSWHAQYWDIIKKSLNTLVKVALHNFIQMATDKSLNNQMKLLYLSYVSEEYNYCDNWYNLIDDFSKLSAAFAAYSLKDNEKSVVFIQRINDMPTILREKKSEAFTNIAMTLLEMSDSNLHQKILLEADRLALHVNDPLLLEHACKLSSQNKCQEASQFLKKSSNFSGKNIAIATNIFYSHKYPTRLLDSLKQLFKEKSKDRNKMYWLLLRNIIIECLNLTKGYPAQTDLMGLNVKLYGWLVLCCEEIQKETLSPEAMIHSNKILTDAINYVKRHALVKLRTRSEININAYVKELFEEIKQQSEEKLLKLIEIRLENVFSSPTVDHKKDVKEPKIVDSKRSLLENSFFNNKNSQPHVFEVNTCTEQDIKTFSSQIKLINLVEDREKLFTCVKNAMLILERTNLQPNQLQINLLLKKNELFNTAIFDSNMVSDWKNKLMGYKQLYTPKMSVA